MKIKPSPDALRLTSLITESVVDPILIYDDHAALCMGVTERAVAHLLPSEWEVPGVYILLDPLGLDGTWGCYVGEAPAGLRSRLQSHIRNKEDWTRALLICRDTTHGLNSAHIGWLEGRLYDLVMAAEMAVPHNVKQPRDETLPPYERTMLEACVIPISRTLRLLGYDTLTADDEGVVAENRPKSHFGVTVQQLLESGLLAPGVQLLSLNAAWPASATVNPDGTITVDGSKYPTLSAAAAAVRGGATNGWAFWGVDNAIGRTPMAVLRTQLLGQGEGSLA